MVCVLSILARGYEGQKRFYNACRLVVVLGLLSLHDMYKPQLLVVDPIVHKQITLDTFSDQEYDQHIGFSRQDVQNMIALLPIPEFFTIGAGRHAFRVSGVKCFLYFLFHVHSPSQRVSLDTTRFGYDYSVLSKIFSTVVNYLDGVYAPKQRIIPTLTAKMGGFNSAITEKIADQFPGMLLPVDAIRCAFFLDGCRIPTCRPTGAYWVQYAYFSGDKWYHCHGAQGVMAPDGIFYDLFDGPVGRYCDQHFLSESNVNGILRDCQLEENWQYWAYTDKGYAYNTHIRCAAHGPAYVTGQQLFENWVMAKERIGVEWGYGKVKALCPILRRKYLLKLKAVDVAQLVRVCFFLTNMHTCMNQSQVGLYFNCPAPSLAEYLA